MLLKLLRKYVKCYVNIQTFILVIYWGSNLHSFCCHSNSKTSQTFLPLCTISATASRQSWGSCSLEIWRHCSPFSGISSSRGSKLSTPHKRITTLVSGRNTRARKNRRSWHSPSSMPRDRISSLHLYPPSRRKSSRRLVTKAIS